MEALEIYREETVKLLEHKEECVASGGKVQSVQCTCSSHTFIVLK